MSKRNVGSYVLSDEEDDLVPDPPPTKKARTEAAKSVFKLPLNAQPPRSVTQPPSSSRAVAPAITPNQKGGLRASLLTPRDTPSATTARSSPSPWDDAESGGVRAETPVPGERSKGKQRDLEAGPSNLAPAQPKRLSYEREFHEMNRTLSDCVAKLEEQGKEIVFVRESLKDNNTKLAELTTQFDRYKEAQATRWAEASIAAMAPPAAAPAAAPTAAAAPKAEPDSGERLHLSVEQVTMPNLGFDPRTNTSACAPVSEVSVLSDIIASYQHRTKNKKPSFPVEAKIRKHVREAMFQTLDNVSKAADIKHPYYHPDGTHDLFPAELADPETGYVSAYPDWTKKLGTQLAFVQRFMERFRSSAPKNNSDFSVLARTICEEIIIEILLDGPWKTCVKEWRDMARDNPEAIATRGRQGRRYKRRMAKAGVRTEGREKVPALMGEEYNSMFHEAMMSEEESEGEGPNKVLVVKRPGWRSSYLNAYYDASTECTRQHRTAAQGNSFQPLKRKLEVVDIDTIPEPRRDGKLLPVPLFAFSGDWKTKHKTLISANDHRLNTNLRKGPNIDDFLAEYQRVDDGAEVDHPVRQPTPERPRADVTDENGEDLEDEVGGVEQVVGGDETWLQAVHQNEMDMEDDEAGEEQAGEEQAGEELNPRVEATNARPPVGAAAAVPGADMAPQAAEGQGIAAAANIPLDPAMFGKTQAATVPTSQPAPQSRPKPRPKPRPQPSDSPEPAPSSSIRVDIPAFEHVAPTLPKPYSGDGANPTTPTEPTGTEPTPTVAEPVEPVTAVSMPLGGPLYPPPPLQPDPPPPASLAREPEPATKSKRKRKQADSQPKDGDTGGGGTATTTAATGKKGKEGKKGDGGKGAAGAAEVVPGSDEGGAGPSVPQKRGPGRPRKNKN